MATTLGVCYEEKMQQADQIIFLNFSAWNCLLRAFKRYLKYRGKVRESMAAGCPEQFNWEFIRWILWDGRTSSHKRPIIKKSVQTMLTR